MRDELPELRQRNAEKASDKLLLALAFLFVVVAVAPIITDASVGFVGGLVEGFTNGK